MFQKIKQTLSLSGANIGGSILSSFLWFYLATILTKEHYGETSYLISIAILFASISGIGLPSVIVVYGTKKENTVAPAYSLGLISVSIISIIVYVVTQNILLVFLTLGIQIYTLQSAVFNSKQLFSKYSIYRISRSVITVVSSILLYFLIGTDGIILGFGIGTLISFKTIYDYVKMEKISIRTLRPKFSFMWHNWISELNTKLFWWGDKIIISALLGFTTVGSYHLSIQYVLFLYNIPAALYTFLLPQEVEKKSNKQIKLLFIVISILLVIFSVTIVPHLIMMVLPNFEASVLPIQIMSVSIVPIMLYTIIESNLLGNEKSKIMLFGVSLQTGIYFSLMILLGMNFGITGIALGFVISTISRLLFYLPFSFKKQVD